MDTIPSRLGGLKLVRQIGLGRRCQVWEAVDESGRPVAAKVIVPEAAHDVALRRLLEHELKVACAVRHPSIIRIDRFSEEGGLPHLVMEFYPHPNLKRQIAGGVDALASRVPRIVTALSQALDHVHSRGWVHRDVKPDNVLASPAGEVKLIDLAIAARAPGLVGRLIGGRGPAQGSPSYMAPEQIRGLRVDARADIYSLGCVIFELLGGRPPFTAAQANDLLNKHVSAPPPAVETINRNVAPAISRLIRQMMAKQPDERPQSMQEVLRQVREIRSFLSTAGD
ncbi:MAG: serine/threonine protein kinase [Planctomycetia bacterium]|nr:serine/threonine protein kinase [Planctomycetia bacterium]